MTGGGKFVDYGIVSIWPPATIYRVSYLII